MWHDIQFKPKLTATWSVMIKLLWQRRSVRPEYVWEGKHSQCHEQSARRAKRAGYVRLKILKRKHAIQSHCAQSTCTFEGNPRDIDLLLNLLRHRFSRFAVALFERFLTVTLIRSPPVPAAMLCKKTSVSCTTASRFSETTNLNGLQLVASALLVQLSGLALARADGLRCGSGGDGVQIHCKVCKMRE